MTPHPKAPLLAFDQALIALVERLTAPVGREDAR